MSDRKNIDRLFQEKFKDFEASPEDSVWENISAELQVDINADEKVKAFPLWAKLAGIAAGLALLLFLGNLAINNNETNTGPDNVVNTDADQNTPDSNDSDQNQINNLEEGSVDDTVVSEDNPDKNGDALNKDTKGTTNSNPIEKNPANDNLVNKDNSNAVVSKTKEDDPEFIDKDPLNKRDLKNIDKESVADTDALEKKEGLTTTDGVANNDAQTNKKELTEKELAEKDALSKNELSKNALAQQDTKVNSTETKDNTDKKTLDKEKTDAVLNEVGKETKYKSLKT